MVELTVFLSTNQTGEEFFARYQGGADHFFDGDAFLAPEQRLYLLVTVIDVEAHVTGSQCACKRSGGMSLNLQ